MTGSVACCVCSTSEARPWRVGRDNLLGGDRLFNDVLCVRCGLVRLDPRPAPEEMGSFYRSETYARAEGDATSSGLARRLDEYNRRLAGRVRGREALTPFPSPMNGRGVPITESATGWREALDDVASGTPRPFMGEGKGVRANPSSRTALDIGCGDGRFLAALAEQGWTVTGLETDPVAANLAWKRTGGTVYEAELETLPESATGYDLVSMLHVLEHVPDPRSTLREVCKRLKPGGTLLLALPNVKCLEAALFRSYWYQLDLPRHYWGFSPNTLCRLLEECGFTVTRVQHFPFLFTLQSIRNVVRALRGKSNAPQVSEATLSPGSPNDLRTRLFLANLNFSEWLGQIMPGEVMELEARRTDSAQDLDRDR